MRRHLLASHAIAGVCLSLAMFFGIRSARATSPKPVVSQQNNATPGALTVTANRLLVPVLELRFERPQGQAWSWAAAVAYGGDQRSENFAEIGVLGGAGRANYALLGDLRMGVGLTGEVRAEYREGIGASLDLQIGVPFEGLPIPADPTANQGRLQATSTIIAGGAGAFVRASRRQLFIEVSVLLGWQQVTASLVLDKRESERTQSSLWVPWTLSIGAWL